MMTLISTEFEAVEKSEPLNFDINPLIYDTPGPDESIRPEEMELIEIPPAPPVIEHAEATEPTEPISQTLLALPPIIKPILNPNDFVLQLGGRDAQHIVRIKPKMPLRAQKSGHCMVRFDVSAAGKPFNVLATHCSEAMFERESIKTVLKWTYHPKIQGGKVVARKNVVTRLGFHLLDERGRMIPE